MAGKGKPGKPMPPMANKGPKSKPPAKSKPDADGDFDGTKKAPKGSKFNFYK